MSARTRSKLARAAILAVVGLGIMLVMTAGTVTVTSRSQFCNSCHIMEPYYESWANSPHHGVDCVDCHFEPGLLETAEGKFKALSQLAKEVTRTAGTKPWAEVSDQSCMRSGCHSERLLGGTIPFGPINFDHRHHLLETRRGRQLRCTSCHSGSLSGHMAVSTVACFLCHFRDSQKSTSHGECGTCHGPPPDDLVVDGKPFRHSEWTARGVDCVSCHRNVTRGEGRAKKNRCNACHPEARHIERFDDVPFVHETHITEHKVECDQCHEPIEHGLLARDHVAMGGDCTPCHDTGHDVQRLFRAGKGGEGVDAHPDRMFETRVDCTGCHHDWFPGDKASRRRGRIAPASAVGCIHCHGPDYEQMLGSWKTEVQGALEPLAKAFELLEPSRRTWPAPLEAARANLDLVRDDGSSGAHNIAFAMALLRSARDALNAAGPGVDPAFAKVDLAIGLPRPLETTCATACHVDIARKETRFAGVRFKHFPHLADDNFDCNACHSEGMKGADHGQTTIAAADCKQCHHGNDKPECATCHDREAALLRGTVAVPEVELDLKHEMAGLKCSDCHKSADAKDVVAEVRAACIACHDKKTSYGEMLDQWREAMAEERASVEKRLAGMSVRAKEKGSPAKALALLERARTCFEAAASAGPAHNVNGASALFTAAGEALDACEAELGK